MKRSFLFLATLVLLLSTFLASPVSANIEPGDNLLDIEGYTQVSEQEPNEYFTEANSISLEDEVTGTMSYTDWDMYRITIPKSGDFMLYGQVLEQTTSQFGQISVVIYKEHSDGTWEAFNQVDSRFDQEGGFYAQTILESGTYILQLTDNYDTTRGEKYTFTTMLVEPDLYRIAGQDRYETAVNVAYDGWSETGAYEILLATGSNFPDALAAGPLGYYLDAPILLTPANSLPKSVIQAIRELGVEKVTIIGGPGAVSQNVENYLKNTLRLTVERIYGSTRYETAVQIANKLPIWSYQKTSIVVSGQNYPDALSIGSYAASHGIPILLTESKTLPSSTATQVKKYSNTFVIGGTGAVSENVLKQLPKPVRIGGENRYETSANVSKYFYSLGTRYAFVTTGENFADALASSVLAGFQGSPIVLTTPNALHPAAKKFFASEKIMWYTIIGGTGAVSVGVENEIRSLIKQ